MSTLGHRGFRRLWIAGLISDAGDWLLLVSLPIIVYQYTGSTAGTALAFLVELAPPVLLAPIAGRIADRRDRRLTLIVISVAQAAALTPLLLVHGRDGLLLVYLVVVAQSALASVFEPTKNALLPTLVEDRQVVSANSLVGLNENVGRLIGGSLGGVLLATGGGLSLIVAADGISFLVAAALIAGVARGAAAAPSPACADSAISPEAGWAVALSKRPVRGGLLVLLVASVAQGMFVVLFIVFVARVLHGGSAEIGLLRGVQAIGAIGAGLALAATGRVGAAALTAWTALAFGLLDLAIWNAPTITSAEPLYIVLFIAAGAPGIGLQTGLTSAMQRATREGQRGAVFAAMGVAMAIGEATGIIAAGVLGDRLGVVGVLDAQGVLYLIAGLLAARLLTARRRGPRRHRRRARLTRWPSSASPTSSAWRSDR
jgi:MFS family permease